MLIKLKTYQKIPTKCKKDTAIITFPHFGRQYFKKNYQYKKYVVIPFSFTCIFTRYIRLPVRTLEAAVCTSVFVIVHFMKRIKMLRVIVHCSS